MNNQEIDIKKLKQISEKLAKKHRLDLVALFGSQAKGKTHPQSDVDIAIMGRRRLRPIEIARIALEFSELLKREDVEIVDLKSASPLLLKQVAEHSILLFESKSLIYPRFKIYAYKLYMEAKPLFVLQDKQIDNFIKKYAGQRAD